MTEMKPNDDMEYLKMEKSILYWIDQVFHIVPQPVKPAYQARFELGLAMRDKAWDAFCATVRPEWFEEFRIGHHLTWQQALVLYGVDKATRGQASVRLSIVSGHGIGKSMMLSIIILWFLFIHPYAQVACTAPTASSLYDVLWKEIKKWIDKMPPGISAMYQWETTHIRMKENPETWFARAKTSSKENTEALAGVHADWVLVAVDEASGVEEPIFETMEGALTSGNVLVFLISNGTRSLGYFYDTHHKDTSRWQNYAFSSLDSPHVNTKYIEDITAKYGEDSIQYAIRVKGEFPSDGIMDDSGYVQLFNERELHMVPFDREWKPIGRVTAGLDPSGEGEDLTTWAIKDRSRIAIVATEQSSSPMSLAIKSLTLCDKYGVYPIDLTVDSFGVGYPVSQEIALATSKQKRPWRILPINTGEPCDDEQDKELYINIKAKMFYKFMLWCRAGGEIMDTPGVKEELLSIRFKRTSTGRIQIMSKLEMRKLGYKSPNKADALSFCFMRPDGEKRSLLGDPSLIYEYFDAHSPLGE